MQKRAIRLVHKVGFYEHTNTLFLKSRILKFKDLVDCKTAQFVYKAKHNLLPTNIQKMFMEREGELRYNLRGRGKLKEQFARTTLKGMCLSVCGVKLWNSLSEKMKERFQNQCLKMRSLKSTNRKMSGKGLDE